MGRRSKRNRKQQQSRGNTVREAAIPADKEPALLSVGGRTYVVAKEHTSLFLQVMLTCLAEILYAFHRAEPVPAADHYYDGEEEELPPPLFSEIGALALLQQLEERLPWFATYLREAQAAGSNRDGALAHLLDVIQIMFQYGEFLCANCPKRATCRVMPPMLKFVAYATGTPETSFPVLDDLGNMARMGFFSPEDTPHV